MLYVTEHLRESTALQKICRPLLYTFPELHVYIAMTTVSQHHPPLKGESLRVPGANIVSLLHPDKM